MSTNWITIQEAANLCGVSYDAMKKSVQRGSYAFTYVDGVGKGGRQLRIALESLPQNAQERYVSGTKSKPAPELTSWSRATEKQKQTATLKLEAVNEYNDFKRKYHKRGVSREFIRLFKEKHHDFKISSATLEDWVNKYAEYGVDGLIDRRGWATKGETSLTKDMQDVFKAYYLTDKKPSISQAYKATKYVFETKGVEIPSESSFKRYIYEHIPKETVVLYRDGIKAFDDNILPAIFSDYNTSSLYSNSMWVADHHECDVLVKFKDKVIRPWITAITDFKSRYIVGYIVFAHKPNSDIILDCLARAVKSHGVPDSILTDNGKDYKSHDLFNVDDDMSIAALLQLSVRTAIPYNAKAKPIERNFRTIEGFCKMLPSYIGDRPENRPTTMKGTNQMIERKNKAMDFEKFKKFIDDSINVYHNTAHSGNGMNGRTPLQTYKESLPERGIRILSEEALHQLFRRTTRTVKITEHGIKLAELPNIGYYISAELLLYGIGKRVFARYDTADVKNISVFSEDGKYICEAQSATLFVYGAGKDVQKQVIRDNAKICKALKDNAQAHYPHGIEVPPITEIVARRSEAFGAPDFSDIPKTDCTDKLKLDNIIAESSGTDAPEPEEFTYGEENDIFINLGNIGKNAM